MHPIFVRLHYRLDKAKQELAQIDAAEQLLATLPATETTCWVRRTSLAAGIESVYSEIENVLKAIAVEIDGYMPTGEDWHAKLLEILALPIADIRPAVLSPATRDTLDQLRRFRHVVRNRYGFDLQDEGIVDNLNRLKTLLPAFETDFNDFMQTMSIK